MGAVMSLQKKTYLSLGVSSTNVITIQFVEQSTRIQNKTSTLSNILQFFFFLVAPGIENQFLAFKTKINPPNPLH